MKIKKLLCNGKPKESGTSTSKTKKYSNGTANKSISWASQNLKSPSNGVSPKSESSPLKIKNSPSNSTPTKRDIHGIPRSNIHGVPLQIVRGVTVPAKYSRKNVEDAMDWMPRKGDIIIASYSEAGVSWLQSIILRICSWNQGSGLLYRDVTFKIVPLIEKTGTRVLEYLYEPRIYKHHLPYHKVQRQEESKCIYLFNNPRDTFAFIYYSECKASGKCQNVDQLFERFLKGEDIQYGSYYEHVMSFYRHEARENLLLVSFENLFVNRSEEILRLVRFLDREYFYYLLVRESALDELVQNTSIEYVKHISNMTSLCSPFGGERSPKRKLLLYDGGQREILGEGKRLLSAKELQILKQITESTVKETPLLDIWYPIPKCLNKKKISTIERLLSEVQ